MQDSTQVKLGIIGGTGLYNVSDVTLKEKHQITTPFGAPSAPVMELEIGPVSAYFIARHGLGHTLLPQEVNSRANIYALKSLGVTHLVAVSAVGIMREDIKPGDIVIPNQIFDRTKGVRQSTFFGDGVVAHVPFADPFCEGWRALLWQAATAKTSRIHDGGTYICMEGPQFSTRAESHFYRKTLTPSVIGMTAIPEAKLAREAEICYGILAMATDYDCWHETEEDVSVSAVVEVLKANSQLASSILLELATILPSELPMDSCQRALEHSLLTPKEAIAPKRYQDLALLIGKYVDR